MLVLLDRGFDSAAFLTAVHRTGAMLLARGRSQRVPPVLRHLPDGSYLSNLDGLAVRIIEADLQMSGADGTAVADRYRLITTLLDADRFPADALIRLYHERWEIESAYLALRHTMLHGHMLRSGDRAGLEQEVWALLTLYQLLRMAMTTAVETRPGTDPDRASFTTALYAARDQLSHDQPVDSASSASSSPMLPPRSTTRFAAMHSASGSRAHRSARRAAAVASPPRSPSRLRSSPCASSASCGRGGRAVRPPSRPGRRGSRGW
ncbi:transposase [Pseudonocardia nigra]|uniref:transposase n=1 Tax=Pseudonocardia nigra TaxID=1921578 RepID=UPI001C5F38A3|nr:transposase [Pseudonocardia nigra]